MEDVLEYLEMKNHYYEKFFSITKSFLEQINRNQWDDLEFFVDNRERILSIIRSFDFQISRAMDSKSVSEEETEKYRLEVKVIMQKRSEIAAKIVAIDLEVIARIDDYKSDTIRELKKTVATQNQVNSFSPSPPNKKMTRVA